MESVNRVLKISYVFAKYLQHLFNLIIARIDIIIRGNQFLPLQAANSADVLFITYRKPVPVFIPGFGRLHKTLYHIQQKTQIIFRQTVQRLNYLSL